MAASKAKTFSSVLKFTGSTPRWTIAPIPVDLKKAWPGWASRRVIGEINGVPFHTSLFPVAGGKGHMLVVNRRMQVAAKAAAGSRVTIRIEPDMEDAAPSIPMEMVRAFEGDRRLHKWFDKLSPSMRKGMAQLVDQAMGAKTRTMRADRMAECLMLAMEGEQTPPPILRAAFQRQPLAQAGWNAMTATQRRNELLGIFYQQTVQARERRLAKTIEAAVRKAPRSAH